jgi:hypothetical protein
MKEIGCAIVLLGMWGCTAVMWYSQSVAPIGCLIMTAISLVLSSDYLDKKSK